MPVYRNPCKRNCLLDFCRKEVKFIIPTHRELRNEVPVHWSLFVYPVCNWEKERKIMKERINLTTLDHKNIDFGKEYNFTGYKWIPIKIDKERNIAVIQSLGVTAGPWPGYILPQFGNGKEYYNNIVGKNVSNYDKQMQDLYEFIKKVEATSEDGEGLYLLNQSVESLPIVMKALAKAADNKIHGSLYDCVWLGDTFNDFALYVDANEKILYGTGQNDLFVVAPAFNLDLSKVEIRDDEIVIKKEKLENQSNSTPYRSIWEYGMDFVNTKDGETMHVTPEMVRQIFEAIKEDNGRNYVASYTSRKFTREQYIAVCDEVENRLADDSGDAEYRACEHVLGEGFDKTETWIIKSMFTANHESRTVEHPETFSSEQEAWNRVKSLALADQDDKEVAEVRYNKDACEAMVICSDKTFCKFFAEKTDTPETLPLDGNTWEKQKAATLELGETYRLAGYNWTACELINDGRTAVLQSHGVTSGAWPGLEMAQFGNGDYYADSIDGQDISAYDHKLKELYNAIKDVEDKSATYGKGLYLVSKEKVGFTKCGKQGSGYYWTALKEAAMNYQSFGAASNGAWLDTVSGSGNPLCVDSNGGVYNGNLRSSGFVVAPAFNLDLSKVEIVGDEIIIKPKNLQKLEIDKMLTISSRHVSADTKDLLDQAADDNEEDPMPPVDEKQGYGWFVACDPDNKEIWDNCPADLVQCMKLARDNGCFWLCLDADGPRVETLEFFD